MFSRSLLLPFVLCLLNGVSSRAETESTFPFSGRIYADHYGYVEGVYSGQVAQTSLSAWLEFDSQKDQSYKKGFGIHAVGQGDFLYRSLQHDNSSSSHFRLREGYASYIGEGTLVRAGQQIIPWGKSDGINPTDYFSAKDYTIFNPDDEVKRIGAPAFLWDFTPDRGNSPFNIQAIFQAYYPQTLLIIPDQVIPTGVAFEKYASHPPAFSSNSMEFGFKFSYLKTNYDFSFSYFQGYNHTAEYTYNPAIGLISPFNPRQTAIGGDASFTVGDYVIRVETAVLMPDNGTDTDPLFGLVEPWHWDTVAGFERSIGNDFHLQIQGVLKHLLYYANPNLYSESTPAINTVQRAVGSANALILNYQQPTNVGGTFRFGYANDSSRWRADVFFIGYFTNGFDGLVRPQVGYRPIDNFQFTGGFDLFVGDEDRPLGALKDRSTGFLEAKYTF